MTRSTPLDQLQNKSNENNMAFEENENQLVNEILKEIEDNEEVQPTQEQEITHEVNTQHQQKDEASFNGSFLNETVEEEQISFYNNIINNTKMPLLAGIVAVILSIPQINTIIVNIVLNSGLLSKYSTLFTLLIKFVLAVVLFYLAKQNL